MGGDQILLGSASVSKGNRDDSEDKKAVSGRELKNLAFDGLQPFEWM